MNRELIEKFFKNECSPDEVKKVLDWFSSKDLQPWQEDDLRVIWQEVEKDQQDFLSSNNAQEMLRMMHVKMKKGGRVSSIGKPIDNFDHSNLLWAKWIKVAAVLLIPLVFTILFLVYTRMEQEIKPIAEIIIETPAGMKRTKILPDGSKVVLNSRSSITYLEEFSEHKREISVVGEAFFEVSKDSSRPFIVNTGGVSTTAVGTSFNVYYRPSEGLAEVSLATGIVQVSANNIMMKNLEPGDRLLYDLTIGSFSMEKYDVLETFGWKDGILYFKKAGIDQVIQRLEDWYGVEIVMQGKTNSEKNKNWIYTGMFEDQSLDNVLKGISYVKNFTYEINGKQIIMIFN
jgi:ferric-dicitrate binding protein FerR (iron transport regulator)